jgi:hypothetical protein
LREKAGFEMKKKNQPQRLLFVLGRVGMVTLVLLGLVFVYFLVLYSNPEPGISLLVTPTFELLPDETIVFVSTKLPSAYETLTLGGGTAGILDYVDDTGAKQNGLTMYIHMGDGIAAPEIALVYKGKSWRYSRYYLRVLEIINPNGDNKGMSTIAIRKEN